MKKTSLFATVAALAVVFAASCQREYSDITSTGADARTFTATIDAFQTKTTLSSDFKVKWEDGDEVTVNGILYAATVNSDSTRATFTKAGDGTLPVSPFHAFYPAGIQKEGNVGVLPDTVVYTEGRLSCAPMYATGISNVFTFKNICALLAVAVKDTDIQAVKSIRVSSSNRALSGEFSVNDNYVAVLSSPSAVSNTVTLVCEEPVPTTSDSTVFYIPVPAQTYRSLKVELSADGVNYEKEMMTTLNTDITVSANTIYPFNFVHNNPTKITTAEEFLAMLARPQSDKCDTVYTIMNDIDFTGVTITPDNCYAGDFYASVDGRGHKFTNYTATSDMIHILYGTFKDLTIESGSFTMESDHSCGVFFEQIEKGGVAENLINKAGISGTISTTSTFHQGAICGICRGHMKDCKNYGDVTISLSNDKKGSHYRFGGIAGSVTPASKGATTYNIALENCENHGNIEIKCIDAKATTYLGGITAVADSKECTFTINGCSNAGKLSITNPDGFVSSTAKAYVGGLVGQRNVGEIKNCTNTGDIDVTALKFENVFAGGLVAFQKAGYSGEAFQGCSVNANVKASFKNESSTTANPLANAGMVIASVGDAGVTFGSENAKIKVGGALWNGSTEIKVTAANLEDLAIGSASIAPTLNISLAN